MAVLLIIHCQNQNLQFHKETMFTLGLNCLIIGIERLSHQVVTQYIERLNQSTPPFERCRIFGGGILIHSRCVAILAVLGVIFGGLIGALFK